MKAYIRKFYVVTKDGVMLEVEYKPKKKSSFVKVVYCADMGKSNIQRGYKFFSFKPYIGLTLKSGFFAFNDDNGKRRLREKDWVGKNLRTSGIVGLFLRIYSAYNFCNYYLSDPLWQGYRWYYLEESINVLKTIGTDHISFIVSKDLQKKIKPYI